MKSYNFIKLFIVFFLLSSNNLLANIKNSIIVKVGSEIITNIDVENEVKTLLILNNKIINQANINNTKKVAVRSLVRRLVKKNEINKFKINQYNEQELSEYQIQLAKKLNIQKSELIKIFNNNNISYENFLENQKIDLIWNTLIYSMYQSQIAINPLELENEISRRLKIETQIKKYKLSEIEIVNNQSNNQVILEDIYKTIKNENFESAVKKFSISTSNINNGDIGWFNEEALTPILRDELSKIKKGQVSRPIRSEVSVTIFKIIDIRMNNKKNFNIDELKNKIIVELKEKKLNLFSRSHFSNVENSLLIKFL
jgi:peptidyl-prolyl cis-trans isomerase SurA